MTNTLKRDECVKGTRADQTAPEQRMPSHEPLNKLLSLPTAQSPGRFCAHCSRLAPSGVPTQSSPLLPLDPYTENANSAHFAQLKAPQQHFPQGVALSAPQEANPISQTGSQPSQSRASCNPSLTLPAVPGAGWGPSLHPYQGLAAAAAVSEGQVWAGSSASGGRVGCGSM